MLSIQLHNLILFAHHGIYEEEKILGNEFSLDISIRFSPQYLPVKHMADTIDYVAVYELVKKRMDIPTLLLETVITEIAQKILAQFSLAEEVFIAIRKTHPPISQFQGSVGVSFELKRNKS
ncbi:MAG: dihydroneopterin aldolase [Sediminibacterium sp.]|nr:dihydroneopterin aldolase [Sediminibacterium sp.]